MPKKSKKTKRRVSNTLKNAIKIVIDNSKKTVRVNSSKQKSKPSEQIYAYPYSVRPNLSALERTMYENEISTLKLQNPLGVKVRSNTAGKTLNMGTVATQTPPDPQLSPSTMATTGIEAMRRYLINNNSRIPTKKTYSDEEIEKLQPNRISELYAQTRQNILNAPQTPSATRFGFFLGGSAQREK